MLVDPLAKMYWVVHSSVWSDVLFHCAFGTVDEGSDKKSTTPVLLMKRTLNMKHTQLCLCLHESQGQVCFQMQVSCFSETTYDVHGFRSLADIEAYSMHTQEGQHTSFLCQGSSPPL